MGAGFLFRTSYWYPYNTRRFVCTASTYYCCFSYSLTAFSASDASIFPNTSAEPTEPKKTFKNTHKKHLYKQFVDLGSEKYNIQTELNLLCSLKQASVFP